MNQETVPPSNDPVECPPQETVPPNSDPVEYPPGLGPNTFKVFKYNCKYIFCTKYYCKYNYFI